jgi:NADH:ubiquinone oxidoreductase subunit F (NADH-binding)
MSTMIMNTSDRLLTSGQYASTGSALADHLAIHGALPIPSRVDPSWRADLIRTLAESGLLGRGGAGFPASRKWEAVSATHHQALMVVNAMEGEPASAKDKTLLSRAPHLVLDGAEVAAAAVGASGITICVAEDNRPGADAVERAIAERKSAGLVRYPTVVMRPPGRYVTGEESALIGWLNNKRALPTLRLDKSLPLRVSARPVIVHNVETLAQVALIARYGPVWFRQRGIEEAPGTTLVTVSGAVSSPGVFEVDLGTPLIDILQRAEVHSGLSAVLLGGYGGTWLSAAHLDTPYAPSPLAAVGATLGVGIVVALSANSCGIAETTRIARYMAGQSAGQCGPCVFGLPAIAADLEQLSAGSTDPDLIERIWTRAATIEGRGACRHPDGVVRLVRSAMVVFADDVTVHSEGGTCAGCFSESLLPFPMEPFVARKAS